MGPTVIALTGLPGTGKSTLGAALYPFLPREFAYLDLDTLTQPLVRAALAVNGVALADAAANGMLRQLRDAQYACLYRQVRELVAFERSVLMVAPMTHELEDPSAFRRVAASFRPARFMLIRIWASPRAAYRRLEQRGDFLDALRLSRWELDSHRYQTAVPLPIRGLELDSSEQPPHLLAKEALRWVASQREFPTPSRSEHRHEVPTV